MRQWEKGLGLASVSEHHPIPLITCTHSRSLIVENDFGRKDKRAVENPESLLEHAAQEGDKTCPLLACFVIHMHFMRTNLIE